MTVDDAAAPVAMAHGHGVVPQPQRLAHLLAVLHQGPLLLLIRLGQPGHQRTAAHCTTPPCSETCRRGPAPSPAP